MVRSREEIGSLFWKAQKKRGIVLDGREWNSVGERATSGVVRCEKDYNDDTGMRLPTLSNRSQDFKNAMKRRCRNLDGNRCRRLSGLQMLNDDEIVTSVQAESDPVDNETDEDEDNNNEAKVHQMLARFLR
ncbi:hypothetical protein TNCV_3355141 [Trichonephila clavipes]|nr:hypothetical protein TNCV_3355141 [Trichonephila clavipes]